MVELGRKYKDKITGFEGTATGFCTYISGCNQALLAPLVNKDGEFKDSNWFDEQRLVLVGSSKVKLDNEKTPGPDKPAPKR